MKKRVVIIHGYDGSPDDNWKPWLRRELESRGIEVIAPFLPNPLTPKLEEWLSTISKAVGAPDENTHFIAHSLGCSALVHYFSRLPKDEKVGGVIFVAGFVGMIESPEMKTFSTKDETVVLAKGHIKKSVVIYSTDDPYVDVDSSEKLVRAFGAEAIVEINKGHFSEDEGIFELPKALELLVSF